MGFPDIFGAPDLSPPQGLLHIPTAPEDLKEASMEPAAKATHNEACYDYCPPEPHLLAGCMHSRSLRPHQGCFGLDLVRTSGCQRGYEGLSRLCRSPVLSAQPTGESVLHCMAGTSVRFALLVLLAVVLLQFCSARVLYRCPTVPGPGYETHTHRASAQKRSLHE